MPIDYFSNREIGRKYNRLTILEYIPGHNLPKKTGTKVVCRCDCGKIITTLLNSLRRNISRSCGCLRNEIAQAKAKHSERRYPREYHAWQNMRQRCGNPNRPDYKNYGGRGIVVCEQWLHSFEKFLTDMGECPPKHWIDRINNDGPYSPDNCEWATPQRQQRHRRSNLRIQHQGLDLTVVEWTERTGVKRRTIEARYHAGWPPEQIFGPVRKRG